MIRDIPLSSYSQFIRRKLLPSFMPPKRKSRKRAREKSVRPQDLIQDVEQEEIRKAFNKSLNKGEKTLSLSKCKATLKNLGIDAKSDEIESFANDQAIEELDEYYFLNFAASKRIQIGKAKKAFGLMDTANKGVVVLEDLQHVSQELGEDLSRDELVEMIELIDRSGDGMLFPNDFVRIAKKVNL